MAHRYEAQLPSPELLNANFTSQLFLLSRFLASANYGRHWTQAPMNTRTNPVPSGPRTITAAIPDDFFINQLDEPNALPADVEALTDGSPQLRMPSELLAEGFGSTTNPSNFLLLERAVNRAKGRIETFNRNMSPAVLTSLINRAIQGDEAAAQRVLESLAEVRCFPTSTASVSKLTFSRHVQYLRI